jgi:ribosome-binding ATPase YchF (GTP1/OBG family)
MQFSSWEEAKNNGAIRQIGKDYIVQEADIIKILI